MSQPIQSSSERRTGPRRAIVGMRLQSQTLRCRVVDVSGTGLGIETPQWISEGDDHSMEITYGGRTMKATGRVRWIRKASEVSVGLSPVEVYRAGLELERVPPS